MREQIDRLTATVDQLQAELDRLRKLLAVVMATALCVLLLATGRGQVPA